MVDRLEPALDELPGARRVRRQLHLRHVGAVHLELGELLAHNRLPALGHHVGERQVHVVVGVGERAEEPRVVLQLDHHLRALERDDERRERDVVGRRLLVRPPVAVGDVAPYQMLGAVTRRLVRVRFEAIVRAAHVGGAGGRN